MEELLIADFNPETLGKHVTNARLFKGSEKLPFLAPRGVHVVNNQLFVSDTGQNRVFIWYQLPTTEYQEPDVILGQEAIEDSGRNAGGGVTASTLHYPSGIWSDGQRLIVADAWNHRVLIWHQLPTNTAQPADVVLGQPNFTTNLPNVTGVGSDPTAQSMHWCYGVWSDGTQLWVADTGNRRVLYYDKIPTEHYTPADKVIGKAHLAERDYKNEDPIWPYSVKVNEQGHMIIADTQFYRALLWKDHNEAFTQSADIIIGQNTFNDCGQNQYRLAPEAHTLNWCYDACFYKKGVLMNDTGNSRILWFEELPKMNNVPADAVIGKRNFTTASDNRDTLLGTQSSLYWQFSLTIQNEQLIIADTGNHRIVIADLLI